MRMLARAYATQRVASAIPGTFSLAPLISNGYDEKEIATPRNLAMKNLLDISSNERCRAVSCRVSVDA